MTHPLEVGLYSVVCDREEHIGRPEREILVPVLHRNIFLSLCTWLSRQLLILRIELLALFAPYRAMHGTATGSPAPTTGR
jgi:hypothetical protein